MQYEELVAMLPDYIAGTLSPKQHTYITQQLEESQELRDALESVRTLNQGYQSWQEEPAPEWHRTAYLARRQKTNQGWLPWLSMATSFAAILLVVFRIEIASTPDGIHIGFGDSVSQVAFKEQADQYLNEWRDEQQAYVAHKLLEYENQQFRRDQQLMATMLEVNNEQRRQDLTQLTSYFAQQRSQDIQITESKYEALFEIQDQDRQDIKNLYASLNKPSYNEQ